MCPARLTRVCNFHGNTLKALAELLAAAGLVHTSELRPWHFYTWTDGAAEVRSGMDLAVWLDEGELLEGTKQAPYAMDWALADPGTFKPRRL